MHCEHKNKCKKKRIINLIILYIKILQIEDMPVHRGMQGVRCTPLSPKGYSMTNLNPPPFLDKLLGIILSCKIEILAFKVFKICYHSVYCIVYMLSLNNPLLKLFPQIKDKTNK